MQLICDLFRGLFQFTKSLFCILVILLCIHILSLLLALPLFGDRRSRHLNGWQRGTFLLWRCYKFHFSFRGLPRDLAFGFFWAIFYSVLIVIFLKFIFLLTLSFILLIRLLRDLFIFRKRDIHCQLFNALEIT